MVKFYVKIRSGYGQEIVKTLSSYYQYMERMRLCEVIAKTWSKFGRHITIKDMVKTLAEYGPDIAATQSRYGQELFGKWSIYCQDLSISLSPMGCAHKSELYLR